MSRGNYDRNAWGKTRMKARTGTKSLCIRLSPEEYAQIAELSDHYDVTMAMIVHWWMFEPEMFEK